LHVAAKANQPLQVELLLVYGADLNKRDSSGKTPEDVARESGHISLADRLHTARFHVFDRLLQYLCSRKNGSTPLGCLTNLDEVISDSSGGSEARTKLEAVSYIQ